MGGGAHLDAWESFSDISIHNAYRNVDPEAWIKGETLEELAANMIAFADEEGWAHDYTVEAEAGGDGAAHRQALDVHRVIAVTEEGAAAGMGYGLFLLLAAEVLATFSLLRIFLFLAGAMLLARPREGERGPGPGAPVGRDIATATPQKRAAVGRAITTGFATGRYVAGL